MRERLRTALAPHVDWLLATQSRDGMWRGDVRGDFARALNVVPFLIWYDQNCEARRDIQRALQRTAKAVTTPNAKLREQFDLNADGEDHEVLRAFAGRALGALLLERKAP